MKIQDLPNVRPLNLIPYVKPPSYVRKVVRKLAIAKLASRLERSLKSFSTTQSVLDSELG